jgi:hypothetical protein
MRACSGFLQHKNAFLKPIPLIFQHTIFTVIVCIVCSDLCRGSSSGSSSGSAEQMHVSNECWPIQQHTSNPIEVSDSLHEHEAAASQANKQLP